MQCQAKGHCDHFMDFQPPEGDIPSTSGSLFGGDSPPVIPVCVSGGVPVKELGRDVLHADAVAWLSCRQAGMSTRYRRACRRGGDTGTVSWEQFSLHFPQLHCQAAPLNRRAENLFVPSVVLGLGAFSCTFQISRFRWVKLGLFHLNVLPGSGHGFRSYSQVCCRHLQCGSFGAEAGEECRMVTVVQV